jgi:hypothetical protein
MPVGASSQQQRPSKAQLPQASTGKWRDWDKADAEHWLVLLPKVCPARFVLKIVVSILLCASA